MDLNKSHLNRKEPSVREAFGAQGVNGPGLCSCLYPATVGLWRSHFAHREFRIYDLNILLCGHFYLWSMKVAGALVVSFSPVCFWLLTLQMSRAV